MHPACGHVLLWKQAMTTCYLLTTIMEADWAHRSARSCQPSCVKYIFLNAVTRNCLVCFPLWPWSGSHATSISLLLSSTPLIPTDLSISLREWYRALQAVAQYQTTCIPASEKEVEEGGRKRRRRRGRRRRRREEEEEIKTEIIGLVWVTCSTTIIRDPHPVCHQELRTGHQSNKKFSSSQEGWRGGGGGGGGGGGVITLFTPLPLYHHGVWCPHSQLCYVYWRRGGVCDVLIITIGETVNMNF